MTYNNDVRRLWVRLVNKATLRQYMEFRRMTNRDLAAATGQVAKRAIIAHLRAGSRVTCSPRTARAIEEALGTPPGLLFVPVVSSGRPNADLKAVAS